MALDENSGKSCGEAGYAHNIPHSKLNSVRAEGLLRSMDYFVLIVRAKMGLRSIYKILEYPRIYALSQWLLVPGGARFISEIYARTFKHSSGLILDVGCGPRLKTPLPPGKVVGVDVNPKYVREFTRPKSSSIGDVLINTYMGAVGSAMSLPFRDDSFDECRCIAVLHHLSDELADSSIKEMLRVTRPGGKIIIFDAVWPKVSLFRPLAWLTWKFDRGEWVRNESRLRLLLKEACHGDWEFERFTYTYTGLEGMICQHIVKTRNR